MTMAVEAISAIASQPEFEIEVGPRAGELGVLEITAFEQLSRPYSAEVTAVARAGVEMDPASALGEEAVLLIHLSATDTRYLHGVVMSFDHWEAEAGADRRRYRIVIAPRFQKLQHRVQSRIFQALTVPQIVKEVLDEVEVECRFALSSHYAKRDFCVQYRESDLAFVSRLLEEEGIFYWFEHRKDGHSMVLCDSAPSCPEIPGDTLVPYREQSGMATTEHVDRFLFRREVRPSVVTLRDFDYLRPALDLTTSARESGEALEVYDYPSRTVVNVGDDGRERKDFAASAHWARDLSDQDVGKQRARTRLEELRVAAETAIGSSTSRRLEPGRTFELGGHPVADFDGQYLILSVKHHAWQPEGLAHAFQRIGDPAQPERERYRNEITCLRKGVAFRPTRETPRPVIAGPQTAIVVGLSSEEIHTDEHGRVKVQFHWDRQGNRDEMSSSWIRVSQAWAGPQWGALFLPRIGHEVVVEFTDGDPDRPLITGSLYNGANTPPASLPRQKTQSAIRSASSPGGDGFNELRFEDAAGEEEVFLHAEKYLDIVVENDKTQKVGGNETLTVDKDRSRTIHGNQSLTVDLNDDSTILQNQSLVVNQNRNVLVMGTHTETVYGDQVERILAPSPEAADPDVLGKSLHVAAGYSMTVGMASMETVGLGKSLNVGADYDVRVGASMNEIVSGHKSEIVMGGKDESIGGDKKEEVLGSREMVVTGDLTETVHQSRTLKVDQDLVVNAKNLFQSATESYTLKSKKINLVATEELRLEIGNATITVSSEGDLVISGASVELNAIGALLLKGASVTANG
jgi:type VI secretion system secreted protein VgrG